MGGLIGIETLNTLRLVSLSIPYGSGTYKLIDKSSNRGTYRFVYVEDRYSPFIYYISIYNTDYKYDYRINKILNGATTASSIKFLYDSDGNIYFQKTDGTRGGILSIQLIAGGSFNNIEKVDSVDGTEITIS